MFLAATSQEVGANHEEEYSDFRYTELCWM